MTICSQVLISLIHGRVQSSCAVPWLVRPNSSTSSSSTAAFGIIKCGSSPSKQCHTVASSLCWANLYLRYLTSISCNIVPTCAQVKHQPAPREAEPGCSAEQNHHSKARDTTCKGTSCVSYCTGRHTRSMQLAIHPAFAPLSCDTVCTALSCIT